MRTLPSDLLLPRGSRGEQGTGIVTTAVKRSITEDKNELHDGKSILISQQTPRRRLHILKRKKNHPYWTLESLVAAAGVVGGWSSSHMSWETLSSRAHVSPYMTANSLQMNGMHTVEEGSHFSWNRESRII